MTPRKIIIIGLVVASVVIGFVLLLLRLTAGPTTLYQSEFFARNLQFASRSSETKVRFFTGSAFAEHDLETNTSTSLTREFNLPSVNGVRWSSDGSLALIQAKDVGSNNELAAQATSLNPKPSWWLVRFSNNAIVPLQVSVEGQPLVIDDALWQAGSNSNLAVSGTIKDGRRIIATGLIGKNFNILHTTAGPGSLVTWDTNIVVFFDGASLGTLTGSIAAKIAGQATSAQLSGDRTKLFYVSGSDQNHKLHQKTLGGADQVLESGLGESIAAEQDGSVIRLSRNADGLFSAKTFAPGGKVKELPVSESQSKFDRFQNILPLEVKGDKIRFLLFDSDGNPSLYSTNREEAERLETAPTVLFDRFVSLEDGYIQYNLVTNHADIRLFKDEGKPFDAQRADAIKEIAAMKIDPNWFKKTWHVVELPTTPEGEEIPGE